MAQPSESGEARSRRLPNDGSAALGVERPAGDLVERASLLRLLAQAFGCPRDARMVEVRAALRQFMNGSETKGRVARTRINAARAWASLNNDDIAAAYTTLFLSPNGVPLREAAYVNARLSGRAVQVADIAGFYRMFGFPFTDTDAEPSDHISVELDFLGWLLTKEAYARAHGLTAQARANEFGAHVFVDQHLGHVTVALVRRIRASEHPAPYDALGALLLTAVAREAQSRRNRRLRRREPTRSESPPLRGSTEK